jgi:GTPase SAR1 family protein
MKNNDYVSAIVISLLASIIGALMSSFIAAETYPIITKILLISSIFLATSLLAVALFRKLIPEAYRIAVVGFPKSGKTTLVTAMFGELFAGHILGVFVYPRGETTRNRVNEDLKRLELGKQLGPTTDQDVFAYRADITRGKFFKRTYKLEIGDFPGDDSQKFTEQFGEWLHETNFFKWVMEADAFILVVDLAHTLNQDSVKEYVAKITSAFRAAWQQLSEYHLEGKKNLRNKSVVLVFTKADLFGITPTAAKEEGIVNKVMQLGFEEPVPVTEIEPQALKIGVHHTEEHFSDLIKYLQRESNNSSHVFVSCFSLLAGRRQGVNELLEKILPM